MYDIPTMSTKKVFCEIIGWHSREITISFYRAIDDRKMECLCYGECLKAIEAKTKIPYKAEA